MRISDWSSDVCSSDLSAWAISHSVAAAQRPMRRSGRSRPTMKATPRKSWMMPMSRTKCWLKKPVSVTPGTSSYQVSGATSMKRPLAERSRPLKATMTSTAASTARLSSMVRMIFLPLVGKGAYWWAERWEAARLSQSAKRIERSAEHTSELPSLMRNSYAVFCLKQKNQYVIYQDERITLIDNSMMIYDRKHT